MRKYLDLLRDVRAHGEMKPTRAVLRSTGKKIDALCVFGRQIRFDLNVGFPLVTTKRMAFGAIVHELIWFLSGSTNIRYLQENGVSIWDQWADSAGELGPVYGKQWRDWSGPDGRRVDQIDYVLEGIKAVRADATASIGRRLIVSAWNPADVAQMALPPCHTLFQFSVSQGRLSCQLYQRSADLFLGVPFNIASYALLTHLFAHVCALEVGEFIHVFGDVHIYSNHLAQVDEQIGREPLALPTLRIASRVRELDALRREDIELIGYQSHPSLRGEVAV
jgi:thymidylate synthase